MNNLKVRAPDSLDAEGIARPMKKKYRFVLFLVVFGGILAGGILYLDLREPVHQGRRLTEWLAELDRHTPDPERQKAEQAIRCIGTNALPHLMRWLQTRDSALKLKMMELAGKQSLIRFPFTTANLRVNRAIAAFRTLGTDAESAIPVLIDWIEGKGSGKMDFRTRMIAISTLRELGPAARHAIPTLIEALKDNDARGRANAAGALGTIGQDSSVVVPALVVSLSDPDSVVRGNSVGALIRFGEQAKAAVPALEITLHDTNANVRNLAMIALEKIAPEREALAQKWKNLLNPSPE